MLVLGFIMFRLLYHPKPMTLAENPDEEKLEVHKKIVGSVVEWLKRRDCDRPGLGSKPTPAILLCPWERHLTALSRA